jgi:inner membrane protein
MLTITHLLVGSVSTGMVLQTTSPVALLVGAVAALLPDIDISTSPAGRILPFISRPLEKRFSHRSATHSLLASCLLALVSYGGWLSLKLWAGLDLPLEIIHALNIGYCSGWFLDCFTKSGVEMFYPLTVRCVCPGNRNLRISTGSPAEYWLMVFIVALALWTFQVNASGGFVEQFNAWIAAPSGVYELYNKEGGQFLLSANYQGVWNASRQPIQESNPIIGTHEQGFLVEREGQVIKVGTEADSNIIVSKIRAEKGPPIMVKTQTLYLEEDSIDPLLPFDRPMTYLSGQVSIDSPDLLRLEQDAFGFKPIVQAGSSLTLDHAPIRPTLERLKDQLITGSLTIKQILSQED